MKAWLLLVPLVALPFALAQTGRKQALAPLLAKTRFEMKAVTTIKTGIREYPETIYTYSEHVGTGLRELWRVTLNDKYAHHWIASDGTVWVLTDSMPGPRGRGRIWARDIRGDQKVALSAGSVLTPPQNQESGRRAEDSEVDVAATTAENFGVEVEQIRFVMRSGAESRLTLAPTSEGISMPMVRFFKAGEARTDLLTELLREPTSDAPQVTWPLRDDLPIAFWHSYGGNPNRYLIQTYDQWGTPSLTAPHVIRNERWSETKPAYAVRTPAGRVLWFEFGPVWNQGIAKLSVFTMQGQPVDSIDLLKLGRFGNSQEAMASLLYKDIAIQRGTQIVPLSSDEHYAGTEPETLRMADRSGRQYVIDIKSTGTNSLTVNATASLNLNPANTKEPQYPAAKLEGSQTVKSEDGKFEVLVKKYTQNKVDQTQLTLAANIEDPVEGRKKVQLWSAPIMQPVSEIKVTNSGRVFALMFGQWPESAKVQQRDFALLSAWDSSGRQLGGVDMIQLKWFGSRNEAEQGISLKNLKSELQGIAGQVEVEGVPVPKWPVEQLTFKFNDGRSQEMYIKQMNDYMPSMYYFGHPKK